MRCILVSHTHWDREWYKTYQSFRARLVDTVDRVLELIASDPGYRFQLDGQAIVLEDYLEIRPERRAELAAAMAAGRIAAGPWYVQPDSLIPTGETHIRNLLEGRRATLALGPCSTVAYTPDSFGHPAQFPQLFAGFDLGPFIYWRGNAEEIDELPSDYLWRAPDGSAVVASHLAKGYFPAWGLNEDVDVAVRRLKSLSKVLGPLTRRDTLLMMNGIDHMLPDDNTREVGVAFEKATGHQLIRGLLDDYAEGLPSTSELNSARPDLRASDTTWWTATDSSGHRHSDEPMPEFSGELLGGRVAHLLPGVWSTHSALKIKNRRCESLLQGWLEPFAALAMVLGAADERVSLRLAWRTLLPNQAHDSICGCSQDRVHSHMATRYDEIEDLTQETIERVLERLTGLGTDRQLRPGPEPEELSIAVFNPSPSPRSDVVRLPLTGFPAYTKQGISPLLLENVQLNAGGGILVDDQPAWLREYSGTVRPRLAPDKPVHDLEFVARDVPALGWRRFTLRRSDAAPAQVDDGREIEADDIRVRVDDQGCLEVHFGDQRHTGLLNVEDLGDRGDTYDFDLAAGPGARLERVEVERRRHPAGLAELEVTRWFEIPAELSEDRATRSDRMVVLPLRYVARVGPDLGRVDVTVHVDNTARDHRLRLLFPLRTNSSTTGTLGTVEFQAATTFGRAERNNLPRDGSDWIHPPPATFPNQGWVRVGELLVAAPGLLESEVQQDGTLALTLLRATGWLSRPDLVSRTGEAGPSLPTPGAQVLGPLSTRLTLHRARPVHASDAPNPEQQARAAELGLWATAAGGRPVLQAGTATVSIEPSPLELSALKPAEDGEGLILRLLNPSDRAVEAQISLAPLLADRIGSVESARLDEAPSNAEVSWRDGRIGLLVGPHALATLRLRTQA